MANIKKKIKNSVIMVYYNGCKRFIYSVTNKTPYNDILQLANTTGLNRHPDLFSFCQKKFDNAGNIKILSFGCSTGEECFTLKEYFPNAAISGCDINKKSLKTAAAKNTFNDIRFFFYSKENIFKENDFDLIFANSVLCKQPEDKVVNNISGIFPFKRFNDIIKELDSALKCQGLFVIRHSNYRLEDTEVGFKYECLSSTETDFPLFDKNGQKIAGKNNKGEIFKKIK